MSEAGIHVFKREAMATLFQVRIADQEHRYAAQAAAAAFDIADHLEALLSRFRDNSEISQIARLAPGETLRLSEPTFACLQIGRQMEWATHNAFSITPTLVRAASTPPPWSLDPAVQEIRCHRDNLEMDLGAIGKGFALDRMAEELGEWGCTAFLLVAGGSTIVAGAPPPEKPGWSSGLGEDGSDQRYWLTHCSLSGSGLAVKGLHILDPRTGRPVQHRLRAWAVADIGAESDALSTACMVLAESDIATIAASREEWAVFLQEGRNWRHFGNRKLSKVVTQS